MVGKKIKNQFELICPHCNTEFRITINADGVSHELDCVNCKRNIKYVYGKVKSATGLTGYVTRQGYVRMDINGMEEEFSWSAKAR